MTSNLPTDNPTSAARQGLNINVTYDSSTANAPVAFITAVNAAVNYLESAFTTPVTVNISVGWGEVGGQMLEGGVLGENSTRLTGPFTYAQIRAALTAQGNVAALAGLPAFNPAGNQTFEIPTAEAKALGLISASAAVDGAIGISNSVALTFDPNNRTVAGAYDAIGTLEHEITELMGRISSTGQGHSLGLSVLDLYRYASPGAHQFTTGSPAYFSLDGGATNLDNFNTNAAGDGGDWAASAGADAFLAFTAAGKAGLVTPADLLVMQALGWSATGTIVAAQKATSVISVLEQPAAGVLHAGDADSITINFSGPVTVSSGAPTLTLNTGGTATYNSGSGSSALTFGYMVRTMDQDVVSLAVVVINPNNALVRDASGAPANLSMAGVAQAGPQIDTNAAQLAAAFTVVLRGAPTSAFAITPAITLANGTSVPNPMYQDAATLATLASNVSSGITPLAKALSTVEHYGDTTTSVATLAYQFFTGATPNSGGYDYLINSPSNANDLNDPYYAKFNEENRYINFAVNLGKLGEGATSFNAVYGSLDLTGAMSQAYMAIFGVAPASGLIASLLSAEVGTNQTRADYFAAYGLDGLTGIGTKAAAAGWLLAVAVESDLGTYAQANDHLLAAMAGGAPPYNVDLVATYAHVTGLELM
jgi:hypothetical protein